MPIVLSATDLVPLATAKEHLRVDHNYDDDLIVSYITAALDYIEDYVNRKYRETQVVEFHKLEDKVELWFPDVENIDLVQYLDADSRTWVTLIDSEYDFVETRTATILFDDTPNNIELDLDENLRVTYTTCSPSDTRVKQAMLLLIGTLYENREDVVVNMEAMEMPVSCKTLLHPQRYLRY